MGEPPADRTAYAAAPAVRANRRAAGVAASCDWPDDALPARSHTRMDQAVHPDPTAVRLIPREIADKNLILPLALTGDVLTVATADPGNVFALDEIARHSRTRVLPMLMDEPLIRQGIMMAYAHQDAADYAPTREREARPDEPAASDDAFTIAPAIRVIDEVLQAAVRERASDIHLEPQEDCVFIRLRIDGIMHDWARLGGDLHPALVSRIKIMSQLNISEKRLPQDGRFGFNAGQDEYDVRVAVIPTTMGEKVVIRLLPKTQAVLALEQLGLSDQALTCLKEELDRAYGMMLVTGPTGSGKTTTLYAALNRIDCTSKNVTTIEDPVEYEFPRVSQIQVHPKIGLDFAAGLRHLLRQDPDVLMIGEIRDTETLQMAVRAALTGHMVFSTVHCSDASATPARLVDMGAEPFLLTSCLTCVVTQRLVRCICPHCKEQYTPSAATYHGVGLTPDVGPLYRGVGCDRCRQAGYFGRRAVFEVMPVSDEVRDAILQGIPASGIRAMIREAGIRSLRDDGIAKAIQGVTTIEEVLRVTQTE